MAVSLTKGANVSLTKSAPGMRVATVGLGWDARVTDGQPFDLDASVFMVDESGKVLNDQAFVFYGNKTSPCQSVVHQGDNLTGEGEGDDEQVKVDLSTVPETVKKLIVAVTIHLAQERGQNFGQVSNASMRIVNDQEGSEVARFDLSEDASVETAMVFGELYRHHEEWKFKAVGQGYSGGLAALAATYGVNVG